jgi:3-hydroxymyristoyl/3-hydroxydecanoyl-(acyl carrier protein) dehydratase
MFELIESISIDATAGSAGGTAQLTANHPLFADHFPAAPILPGSLLIELAAQIAGPLAEEVVKRRLNIERWALLGMIRDAKFLHPVPLPATIRVSAEVRRFETSNVAISVSGFVGEEVVMTAELVMMMIEAKPEWQGAISARNDRLSSWKGIE